MNRNSDADNVQYTDLTEKNEESSVPLNFDYYDKTRQRSSLKIITAAILAFCIIAVTAAAVHGFTKKPVKTDGGEPAFSDAYAASPYADDIEKYKESITDDGLYYTVYERHVRITGYRNVLYPGDLVIPDSIDGLPVAEIDYLTFTFCQLKSITVKNPNCIFFDDGDTPPIAKETAIIAKKDSNAYLIAQKYGNEFIEK